MLRRTPAFVLAVTGVAAATLGAGPVDRSAFAASSTDMSAMQTLINQDRANAGLAPLPGSSCLASIAVQNAERMVAQGYISHSNGPTLDLACGVGSTQAGENVGYLSSGIDDTAMKNLYMASAPHRANILGPYTYVATAWSVAPNGYANSAEERTGTGGIPGPVGASTTINLQVAGRGGVPPSGVGAVALNVTVTYPTAPGYMTVFAAGSARPQTSNLNFVPGLTVPNRVIAKVGTGGQVSLFNVQGTLDLVVDVNGWFTDGSDPTATAGEFTGVTSTRILDTRYGMGGFSSPVGPMGTISVPVAGYGGVPPMSSNTTPSAVVLNVTVTNTTAPSFLRLYPSDANPLPQTSDLNWTTGKTVPNLVIVRPGADGKIAMYNNAGSTDVVVDVLGWYG